MQKRSATSLLLISKIEPLAGEKRLLKEDIIIRMTGCPNGCARSYIAEIGFVGTASGKYNLQLGGDHPGMRLNRIYKESLDENAILTELNQLFGLFAEKKKERIIRRFRRQKRAGLKSKA